MTSFCTLYAYQLSGKFYLLHIQGKSNFYPDDLGDSSLECLVNKYTSTGISNFSSHKTIKFILNCTTPVC